MLCGDDERVEAAMVRIGIGHSPLTRAQHDDFQHVRTRGYAPVPDEITLPVLEYPCQRRSYGRSDLETIEVDRDNTHAFGDHRLEIAVVPADRERSPPGVESQSMEARRAVTGIQQAAAV